MEVDVGKITAAQNEAGYVKFYKMKNYYNWEIKVHQGEPKELYEALIKTIEELNSLMLTKFGGEM